MLDARIIGYSDERERRQDGDGQPYAGAFSSALRYQRLSVPVLPALPFWVVVGGGRVRQGGSGWKVLLNK